MFFQYLEFLIRPFRSARSKVMQARNVKGRVQMDVNRAKSLKNRAKQGIGKAKQVGQQAQQGAETAKQGVEQGAPVNAPAIKSKGMCCWKTHYCAQCESEMDKTWDVCPYCAQAGAEVAPPSASPGAKTRAFMVDAAGSGSQMQLLGWVVPLKGPQRGELYTLAPVSVVGTDPSCTVCLQDSYMSSHHAEIKAEAGVWILRDLGSTNGTYVNDKRIDQHELVDNDFVMFGQSLVKFKTI